MDYTTVHVSLSVMIDANAHSLQTNRAALLIQDVFINLQTKKVNLRLKDFLLASATITTVVVYSHLKTLSQE